MKKLVAMRKGGELLGSLTAELYDYVKVGVSPADVEREAQKLIKQAGGEASFAKVPRYRWATCICINEGVVHGIPESTKPFEDGDVVMVDVGIYYHGYHTDNAFTKVVGTSDKEKDRFLKAGKQALAAALNVISPDAHVGDISRAMQETIEEFGYFPIETLTGHGVGKTLHEEPMIPPVLRGDIAKTPRLHLGQTLAIEIIYTATNTDLALEEDGWTIVTKDGKLSAVFEETVEVTDDGHSIMTKPALFQR